MLSIKNLKITVDNKNILNGVNLHVKEGELHAIMGPNGSGKSTLAYSLMGHPKYEVTSGSILFQGQELKELSADKRAKAGLFLAFQYPQEIEGVTLADFLRQSYNAIHGGTEKQLGLRAFKELLNRNLELLKIKPEFVERFINFGFSGGEKKKAEMLQFATLQPKLTVLDEVDSGLDIDALKAVCDGINSIREQNPKMSFVVITHYQRILNYIQPDFVHVMQDGVIIQSGSQELAKELEAKGYAN